MYFHYIIFYHLFFNIRIIVILEIIKLKNIFLLIKKKFFKKKKMNIFNYKKLKTL